MSIEQVCEILGCKRRRIFQLLSEGTLERAPRYGRALRIFRASVERALLNPPGQKRRKKRQSKALGAPALITADANLQS